MDQASSTSQSAAAELKVLLDSFSAEFLPWIASADSPDSKVLDHLSAPDLSKKLALQCPEEPCGQSGIMEILRKTLQYSANTWHPGFMDKLFASTNPIGVIAELLLAVLNTNGHVFHVSPVLTLMERETSRSMARLFGFRGPHAGGLTLPGGSSSNTLSIVTARTTMFPETKDSGCSGRQFVLFTSVHGHYSVEKAAILLGMGRNAVVSINVDEEGRMDAGHLEECVVKAKESSQTPFYVNATAGTTVYGSFDPLPAISQVCKRHGLWLHIDGSWGGSVAFSRRVGQKYLQGSELADSITVNPHKMLGAPLQCSFLLAPDARVFQRANSVNAGYLFHGDDEGHDMGDSTMGCGRRCDAVKMYLGWNWYGRVGYARRVEHAYDMAASLAQKISQRSDFTLVSQNPPPCLQVCFYYHAPGSKDRQDAQVNTKTTRRVAAALDRQGRFLVDYAPGPHGEFFRAVVNSPNQSEATLDELVESIERLGR